MATYLLFHAKQSICRFSQVPTCCPCLYSICLIYPQQKMIEPEILTEVPAALKRLAKQVVRGFYGVEHALALDVLIRNPCVREEDMLELLKFDRKQLRSVLNTLKADKFVKCRMRVETAPDGKTTRHNYYFINYRWVIFFLVCMTTVQIIDRNTQWLPLITEALCFSGVI